MSLLAPLKKRIAAWWSEVWFQRVDPASAGLFRICIGLLFFAMWACLYTNWEAYYGLNGVQSLTDSSLPQTAEDSWSVFYWTSGIVPLRLFWWAGLLAALGFTIGFQTRLCTIALYVLQTSMIHRNRWVANGEDLVFRMVLFYSCFAPLNHAFSLDKWLDDKKPLAKRAFAQWPRIWPLRLIQVTIALIYVISLPNKLADDVAWSNGTAIYLSVVSNLWSRCPFPSLFYGWLSHVLTYATVLIEGSFPILVWFRKTKLPAIAAIVALHVGIALMLKNVTFFSLSMACSVSIFLPPEITRAALSRAHRWVERFQRSLAR
jgi:hypothetical protein